MAKDLLLMNALLHLMKEELTAQSRVNLQKLAVPQLVNKFPVSALMELKGSVPCSLVHILSRINLVHTCPSYFFKFHFNTALYILAWVF